MFIFSLATMLVISSGCEVVAPLPTSTKVGGLIHFEDNSIPPTRFERVVDLMNFQCLNCHGENTATLPACCAVVGNANNFECLVRSNDTSDKCLAEKWPIAFNASETEWLALPDNPAISSRNRIVPGDPERSTMYNRIYHSIVDGRPSPVANMPKGASPASVDPRAVDAFRAWICALDPNKDGNCQSSNGGDPDPPVESRFDKFQTVFNNRCLSCHADSSFIKPWAGVSANLTEAEWLRIGQTMYFGNQLIVPGNPALSLLATRSQGYQGAPLGGPASMPLGGTLSRDEFQIISDWIRQLR